MCPCCHASKIGEANPQTSPVTYKNGAQMGSNQEETFGGLEHLKRGTSQLVEEVPLPGLLLEKPCVEKEMEKEPHVEQQAESEHRAGNAVEKEKKRHLHYLPG
ncbi:hypothetical protein NDU88_000560 [Pleurodeles waltl]|uniref:Uncharacterized protein n=1 Tax=Pleurodeles waltl TaxID=8319 RepID=A0AAV7P186_PLEWA|nr:hypothetical protein NDU88_000560 [Pleurodeles waltl]